MSGVKLTLQILSLLLMSGCLFAAESAFWVWNRPDPLKETERTQLQSLGIKTLYWEVAELENTTGTWHRKKIPLFVPGMDTVFRIVPVIRLEASVADPFADEAGLLNLIEAVRPDSGVLQIDYDCPDRLIGRYAEVLNKISVPHLSATALAGWIDLDSFSDLASAVEELTPMFYDLKSDTAANPLPLAHPAVLKAQIGKWNQRCKIPWRAGLPWFARVTLYDISGNSRGHIRHWEWDDICFNRNFVTAVPTNLGMTILRADADTQLGDHPISKGETLLVRWPDLAVLAMAEKLMPRAVYFRLPNGSPESGWSLSEVRQMRAPSEPLLELKPCPPGRGGLELLNNSETDLPPRLSGETPLDRGYALEIDAPGPVFRDVEAGDFWRVTGHKSPDSHPLPVAIPLATRLTFWFSALPAHRSLYIPQFQLAPGIEKNALRYRILNASGATGWKSLPTRAVSKSVMN